MVGDYNKLLPYFMKNFNDCKEDYNGDENVERD